MKGDALSICRWISNYQIISIMMILWTNIVHINREIEREQLTSFDSAPFRKLHCLTPTNPIHSSHIPMGKTFFFLFLRGKFRNRSMLFDETLIELFKVVG